MQYSNLWKFFRGYRLLFRSISFSMYMIRMVGFFVVAGTASLENAVLSSISKRKNSVFLIYRYCYNSISTFVTAFLTISIGYHCVKNRRCSCHRNEKGTNNGGPRGTKSVLSLDFISLYLEFVRLRFSLNPLGIYATKILKLRDHCEK
jgi:hypothetical protein